MVRVIVSIAKVGEGRRELKRKAVSGIMLTLLFIGMLTLAFKIQPVMASGTIYIRADGSIEPSDAPISSVDNVTYTFTDNINDSIIVERDNIVIDGASYMVQGTGSGTGIDLSGRSNITVRNAEIQGFEKGIYLKDSIQCTLIINNITNNRDGITVESIGEVLIERNDISSNSESGVWLVGKSNVIIKENTIEQNKNGIATDNSDIHSGIVITNNTILSNEERGIGSYSYGSIHNVTICSNTVSSNGESGILLRASVDGSGEIYDVTICSNTVSSNGGGGISLYSGIAGYPVTWPESYGSIHNVTICSNTVSSNEGSGISLYSNAYGSSSGSGVVYNVTISSNTISSNEGSGICMNAYGLGYWYNVATGYGGIFNVSVCSNTVSSNNYLGVELHSFGGYSAKIFNVALCSNNISLNGETGMILYSAGYYGYIYDVMLSSNIVSSNYFGVVVRGVSHSMELVHDMTISGNIVSANNYGGIGIDGYINANFSRNSISYNMYGVFFTKTTNNLAEYNDIYRNSYGMNVTNGATVNAEYNYWGDPSGPYHESLNVNGTGNSVNGNGVDLDFIPFLTDPVGQINDRPVAVLVADKTTVEINQTVTFDGSASIDDDRIDYYLFDFGDGTNSGWATLPTVTHEYASRGVYNTTLIVMDNLGVTSLDSDLVYVTITVLAPPIANFSYTPEHPPVGETIIFNASTSYDPDGNIENYTWNFGDSNITTVTTPLVTHVYTAPSIYTVNLTVTDNDRLTHSITKSLSVRITSTITLSVNPATVTVSSNVTISGTITPTKVGVNVTISHRLSGGTWLMLATIKTNLNSCYTYSWKTTDEGIYEIKGSWQGDENTWPAESETKTVMVDSTPPTTLHDYDGSWHTTDFTVTLTATDNLSDVAETYYKINDGPTKTVSINGQPLITTEGVDNKLEYWSIDNAGNEEPPHKILSGIKLDKTSPTGSIIINNGDAYTTSTSVTLTVTANDATSGVYLVRYSNDGVWDTEPWETPSQTKAWILTPGDGTKTVYVQYMDNAGLISPSYQDAITLDATKPTSNAGQDQTVNVGATVTFNAGGSTDNVGIVSYEWDFGDGTTGTGITTTHTYTNSGTYTVTLTVKDAAGNTDTHQITITVLSAKAFPMWVVGVAAIVTIGIALATTLLWKRRK